MDVQSGLRVSTVLLSISMAHVCVCVCVYFSGILSGGSRGGLLPRQRVHRWFAADAGTDLIFHENDPGRTYRIQVSEHPVLHSNWSE